MTTIHMETEDVRETVSRLDLAVNDLELMPRKLINAANSLSSVWRGGKANQFASKLQRAADNLEGDVITLQRLSTSLRNEIDEWEKADSTHDFRITLPSYIIPFGEGITSATAGNVPVGWLDNYRTQLDRIFGTEAETVWTLVGLGGVFIPTWVGGFIQVFADLGGGTNDFMGWAINDWEEYDSLGQEIAATLFDFYFASVKTSTLLALDIAEIILDTLDFIPGGYLVTTSVGLALWSLGQLIGGAYDLNYEMADSMGIKDWFVNSVGELLNNAIQSTDSSFDPSINQILTAPASAGYSGAW